jgi:hypothetical protein
MSTFLLVVVFTLLIAAGGLAAWVEYLRRKLKQLSEDSSTEQALHREEIQKVANEAEAERRRHQENVQRIELECKKKLQLSQASVEQALETLRSEAQAIKEHYSSETKKIQSAAEVQISELIKEVNQLRQFSGLLDAEKSVNEKLANAISEIESSRRTAESLVKEAYKAGEEIRKTAIAQSKATLEQSSHILDKATLEASRLVTEAEKRAEEIAGEAYIALRDKNTLEAALTALWNTTSGYGDRYVIPTRSLLDELAEDFGHSEAGMSLRFARERTRRMVEQRLASDCNYVEEDRRQRANRFVVDAFNGRVDAILSRVRHDNYGTLRQEIQDAFGLVNLNGIAFRDARVLPAYLDSRLDELKWAVVVQELKLKEREEQRRIKEQIREEEKARREYEKAIQQAQRDEEIIRQAMNKARIEAEVAGADQKLKLEEKLKDLMQKLAEAEERNQRAISMAQKTKKGNIYIISNIGSFGENIYKIGMTRRLEPMDRVRELGDASVPFEFDVHAIIPTEDAPSLEYQLHEEFDELRVNKVNFRKEFFSLPLEKVREVLAKRGVECSFTMTAEAHEYRESMALSKMTPEERQKHIMRKHRIEDEDVE